MFLVFHSSVRHRIFTSLIIWLLHFYTNTHGAPRLYDLSGRPGHSLCYRDQRIAHARRQTSNHWTEGCQLRNCKDNTQNLGISRRACSSVLTSRMFLEIVWTLNWYFAERLVFRASYKYIYTMNLGSSFHFVISTLVMVVFEFLGRRNYMLDS